ncbi:hypothetical protein Ciccas_012679 [Cichlidogyrus casuarinus]|uniref:Uncharacterized protein n=1 Tax=Cichlidogyrus casuarinus TaxID=1844966 RepID=A0ABD2PNQ4_9PLAT
METGEQVLGMCVRGENLFVITTGRVLLYRLADQQVLHVAQWSSTDSVIISTAPALNAEQKLELLTSGGLITLSLDCSLMDQQQPNLPAQTSHLARLESCSTVVVVVSSRNCLQKIC